MPVERNGFNEVSLTITSFKKGYTSGGKAKKNSFYSN